MKKQPYGGQMLNQAVLDGHKLNYHTKVLEQWLGGDEVWPIYFEVGPTSACNNRCIFCAYSYLGHEARYIDKGALLGAIDCLADHGAKSCMFAGEGEPFLHPDLAEFIEHCGGRGLDIAITSNLLAARPELLERILPHLKWLRCSLNATTADDYELVHQSPRKNFDTVLGHLRHAVTYKKERGLGVDVGVQTVLLPENCRQVPDFARQLAAIGVDYWSIKPCIKHPQMTYEPEAVDDALWNETIATARGAVEGRLTIVAREASRDGTVEAERGYEHCFGLPFFVEIISDGRVFSCGPKLGDDRFCYGTITEESFEAIWQGEKRQEICRHAAETLDVSKCMPSCRLHQINRFLWSLKHPPDHVNFI